MSADLKGFLKMTAYEGSQEVGSCVIHYRSITGWVQRHHPSDHTQIDRGRTVSIVEEDAKTVERLFKEAKREGEQEDYVDPFQHLLTLKAPEDYDGE